VFKKKFRPDGTIESIRLGLWPRVISKKKEKISLHLFTSCPIDHNSSVTFPDSLLWPSRSSDGR
jgi:hypothetical protein